MGWIKISLGRNPYRSSGKKLLGENNCKSNSVKGFMFSLTGLTVFCLFSLLLTGVIGDKITGLNTIALYLRPLNRLWKKKNHWGVTLMTLSFWPSIPANFLHASTMWLSQGSTNVAIIRTHFTSAARILAAGGHIWTDLAASLAGTYVRLFCGCTHGIHKNSN